MSPSRKILGAAAFSLVLAGGGVAGALLGSPSVSIAQSTSSPSASVDTSAETATPARLRHRGERLAVAAEALGMSEDDLKAALKDGQSIAGIATDQGVDVQDVIDALVAHAEANITAWVNGERPERPDRLEGRLRSEGRPHQRR